MTLDTRLREATGVLQAIRQMHALRTGDLHPSGRQVLLRAEGHLLERLSKIINLAVDVHRETQVAFEEGYSPGRPVEVTRETKTR